MGRLALALAVVAASTVVHAEHAFTNDEVMCAFATGVKLSAPLNTSDRNFVEHLTWVADLVVDARVDAMSSEADGGYGSTVTLDVAVVKKGEQPSGPLFLDLVDEPGPWAEWAYRPGETVVLFLTDDLAATRDDPQRFELSPGHFRTIEDFKWTISNGYATLTAFNYRIPHAMLSQKIARARESQRRCAEFLKKAPSMEMQAFNRATAP